MCFLTYFIVYSSSSDFIFNVSHGCYTSNFLFLFTFIMCLECYCFIYVGVNTSTREYENIACRSWECIHKWIDFLNILMHHIVSYQQCHVYDDIQIDVCFEIEKGEMNMQQNTKHAVRKTQIDRQVGKKTYTHDIDSWRQANRQGLCVRKTKAIVGKAPRLEILIPKYHAVVSTVFGKSQILCALLYW